MRLVDLFSGIGGFSLSATWVWGDSLDIACFCERDEFCQKVLRKHWPHVPIVEDVHDLHARNIQNQEGGNYCFLCEQNDRNKQTSGTCQLHMKDTEKTERQLSARIAAKTSLHHQVKSRMGGSSVAGLAGTNTCEAGMDLTPAVEIGCSEKGTPTGMEDLDKKIQGEQGTQRSCRSGEGMCFTGTVFAAKCADTNQTQTTCLEHITSKNGQNTQSRDSIYPMESHYAGDATTKCMECKGRKKRIDLLTAGWPCPPVSVAGRRKGTSDPRWLWPEVVRNVQEFRPRFCLFENVPGLLSIEAGVVFEQCCADLEAEGYEVQPLLIPACGVNAPHRRERLWIVGYSTQQLQYRTRSTGQRWGNEYPNSDCHAAHTNQPRPQIRKVQPGNGRTQQQATIRNPWHEHWYEASARLCTVDDGLPGRLVRPGWRVNALKAAGNSIVPQVAARIMMAIKETDTWVTETQNQKNC